ncbi:MFS transporter [Zhihengliuella salsuginis]|uniref:MFS transporter n=1 Tax=Zhihengliuella salsuginis TaxID=578222 RepID=A0ABQ3GL52_9MICC|nr:MFS transporter [Zhihengliuella salsuginis]GHD13801.1 MFS transporter [Zhihengliuella salsuginis]
MTNYRDLFRTSGVFRIVVSQLVARFPAGMLSLAALIHVERQHDSYAAAGLVLAALAIGQAIAGPLTSRIFGRFGMFRVIGVTLTIAAVATASLALPGLSVPLYAVIAFIAGASTPPIQPAARSLYPSLVAPQQRTALFAFDASVQEIIWIFGPVIVTFLSLTIHSALGILAAAALLVTGGIWFLTAPQVVTAVADAPSGRLGSVLRSHALLMVLAVGFVISIATAMMEAAVVAIFGEGGVQAGLILAVLCASSLVAGFTVGQRDLTRWSLVRRLGLVGIGLALASLHTGFWWVLAAGAVAGAGIAPVIAAITHMTSTAVAPADVAEAFGWSTTAQLVGIAGGSSAAGVLIDEFGGQTALGAAAVVTFAGVALAALVGRGQPPSRRVQEGRARKVWRVAGLKV